MQISTVQHGAVVEVIADGRIDESWADHLASALADVVRRGTHHVRLNMEAVTYLSSAGIGVLMRFYQHLKQINGSFGVTAPSTRVRTILDLAALSPLLLTGIPGAAPADAPVEHQRVIHTENGVFEVLHAHEAKALACRVIGDHQSLHNGKCDPGDMSQLRFPAGAFGFGIGAFGSEYSECRDRFGEFVAAGGAAAYLPTDGASAPDYLVATGSLVPEVAMLYGIRCEGGFSHHLRFAPGEQARDVGLSEIVSTCLKTADAGIAGIVIVAESTGLVGAALRRSPATERNDTSRFDHPKIRKWVTFTAEPAHAGSLCLVVGLASDSAAAGPLQPLLRPVSRAGAGISGHFHAAAFPYRPIQKGRLELDATVGVLFENRGPQGLLHLLWDDREATGAGESRFVRGACWVGPIRQVSDL